MEKMNVFGENNIKESKAAFGIDLGTTNSAISVIKTGTMPDIIRLKDGAVTLPSCVMWKGKPGEFIVGKEAYNNRYKESAIYSVKRIMGSGETITLKYGGKSLTLTPAEVSAEILKELVKQASVEFGDIKDVVITVPAYFDNKQIEDTVKAGRLASLNVLGILREPTSASLLYNQKEQEKKDSTVLVYDLGGGTFDVSLVKISKHEDTSSVLDLYDIDTAVSDNSKDVVLTVLKNEGDMKLGGDDVDHVLYGILENQLKSEGIAVNHIPREEREKLILQMEKIKKSGVALYKIPAHFKLNDANGTEVRQDLFITPDDFRQATKEIYDRTKVLVDRTLNDIDTSKIDSIVLVGGSTKSPIIKEFLRKDFPGVAINDALNPDESVALGAAIQAKRLKFGDDTTEVFDILPLSIGVLADGFVNKVIMKNQTVPYSYTKLFTTTRDDQDEISIEVYQGNSPLKEECLYLGNLIVRDIPRGKAGTVGIPVNLSVDANGLLNCSVKLKGKVTSAQLVNLFGKDSGTKSLDINDKKILRWKRFATTLEDSKRKELESLISQYSNGVITELIIVKFIGDNKPLAEGLVKKEMTEGVTVNEAGE